MKKYILGLAAAVCMVTTASAEVEVAGGADLVSSYTWRGMKQSGPAIQPGVEVSAYGLSVGAWGSSSFDQSAITSKELDFYVGYSIGGLSVCYTNYWWSGEEEYYIEKGSHLQEISIGYEFGESFPLSITWSTMIAGDQDMKGEFDIKDLATAEYADQAFSSYIDIAYPFALGGVDCTASVGITPWSGMYSGSNDDGYSNGFAVASVGLNFSKDIVITDSFSIPAFVDMSVSPAQNDAFLVAGVSFGF